jgi:hypothetical protein
MPKLRSIRIALLGASCFVAGWAFSQLGSWHAHAQQPAAQAKEPFTNLMGYELLVRQPGELHLSKDSTTVELEVYRDNRHGNLVYVTGAGAIAVVPDSKK